MLQFIDALNEVGAVRKGQILAEKPLSEGGFAEYFGKNPNLTDEQNAKLIIEDDYLRGTTAVLMYNGAKWIAENAGKRNSRGVFQINEATRSSLLGGLEAQYLGIIRAAVPTSIVNLIASVQPTTREIATIHMLNFVYGSNKGQFVKGQTVSGALTGTPFTPGTATPFGYSSEQVVNEPQGAGDGSSATISGTLSVRGLNGIRPGTLLITATHSSGAATISDNGNGGLIATGFTLQSGSINYATGAWTATASAGNFTTAAISASYVYDSEGGELPILDVSIVATTVRTQRYALQMRNTIESQQAASEIGVDMNSRIVTAATAVINHDVSRLIISDMFRNAGAAVSTFSLTVPTGVNRKEYFEGIAYDLEQAAAAVYGRTKKRPNVIIVDNGFASLLRNTETFEPAPLPADTNGPHVIGRFKDYTIIQDMHLRNEPGASAQGNALLTYKSQLDPLESAYVHAPQYALYTTDRLNTSNFVTSQGFAHKSANQLVNSRLLARVSLGA